MVNRMAIWAQEQEVAHGVVAPVSVNVVNLQDSSSLVGAPLTLPARTLNELTAKMNAGSRLVVSPKADEVWVLGASLERLAIGVLLHFLDGVGLMFSAVERVFIACLDVTCVGAEPDGASVTLCLARPTRRNVELAGARLAT